MKIFITGAASFIGSALLRQLDQEGCEVTGVDKTPCGSRFSVADIRDKDIADHIPEGADAVVHLAALSRDPDCSGKAQACFDINVMGTLNLMEAAAARGVKQFIFASTEWVYGPFAEGEVKDEKSVIDPALLSSEYALSKYVSECNLRQRHAQDFCDVTILRFGIVYGPRLENWSAVESLTNTVLTQDEVTVGAGQTARSFLHVDDIASGIRHAFGLSGFHIINLQGERLVTLTEVVDIARQLTGKNPTFMEKDPQHPNVRHVNGKRAGRLLGWRPSIDIESGIGSVLDALQAGKKKS